MEQRYQQLHVQQSSVTDTVPSYATCENGACACMARDKCLVPVDTCRY